MANTLSTITPKILARALRSLRERVIMPRLVNGSYSNEAREFGSTIDVPIPSAVSVIDVTPGPVPPTPADTVASTVQVSLSNWKQNSPFHLTDKDMREINANAAFLPMQMAEAIKALANTVNQSIHQQYISTERGVFGYYASKNAGAIVTPFSTATGGGGIKSATNARRTLNDQLAPREDRAGVLDHTAESLALELPAFSDAEKIGSNGVKITGEIGQKFGILWTADDHVLTHTAGTITNGSTRTALIDNGGGYAAGVDTIDVDETSLTGTIKIGDIISFAAHSQTYCVVENTASGNYSAGTYTAGSNAIAALKFYPALQAAVADDSVVTVEPSHVVNLVFHRDAFAFATRPLADEEIVRSLVPDGSIVSMMDPRTGLVLRLTIERQHMQVAWQFDILWGVKLVRPELAMRLAG